MDTTRTTPTPWIIVPRKDGLVNIYHAAKVHEVALCVRREDAELICAAVNRDNGGLRTTRMKGEHR